MKRVIGIVSGKGGVGKTTVALNLGTVLAKHFRKNVTIVDCNVTTSHLGLHLGIYNHPTNLNKVLKGELEMEKAGYLHSTGMNIIPASIHLDDLKGVDITNLEKRIKEISNEDSIILLDSGPGFGRESMAALRACDEVICVTSPYIPSVMDTIRCKRIIEEIGKNHLGIVLNMVNREKYELNKNEVEHLTGLPVISTIPYDKNVNKSLALKTPVTVLNPKTSASKEIFKLASNLIGEEYKIKSSLIEFLKSRLGL
jgi:septum site-determining protein MinD